MIILFAMGSLSIAVSLYFSFRNYMIYKFSESGVFFLGPVIIQAVMYSVICKRLFVGTKELHRKQNVRTGDGNQKEKDSDAIKARKGVVKMLIASVLVYFISYAPTQVPLFYNVNFSRALLAKLVLPGSGNDTRIRELCRQPDPLHDIFSEV